MSILLVHLSDSHLRTETDTLMVRASSLALTVVGEMDSEVDACIICFTGDATDKGLPTGFDIASRFFQQVLQLITTQTSVAAHLILIPGNHDLVMPDDTSLREVAIASLSAEVGKLPPKPAIERTILAPLDKYFSFAESIAPEGTLTRTNPYYASIEKVAGGKVIRFHLVNSAWMCAPRQTAGQLFYPLDCFKPPTTAAPPDYEVTLVHHPFHWFKQPEVMRQLRDAVESHSDLILTGHEHVGRNLTTVVHGKAAYEYREGDALQEGEKGQESGFHLLRLDFHRNRQTITSYHWHTGEGLGAYIRVADPNESALGRNRRRAAQQYRLHSSFENKLDDPELPVLHPRYGKLRLSQFFTYPDLKPIGDRDDKPRKRQPGDGIPDLAERASRILLVGPDRCGKSSLAKRLFADLHARHYVPLLVTGAQLTNATTDRLAAVLEACLRTQYESFSPEAYWQIPDSSRVLILDDLHLGPANPDRRELLIRELDRRFGRVIAIGADEFYYEQLLPIHTDERRLNTLWSFEHFRILPFGYLRREQFVRKWVDLDSAQDPTQAHSRASQINDLLEQFLRNNPIPQYPWVVLIIVQTSDAPEPLHAENGSYGFLLQALITAALAKSEVSLPINGKYRWLAELANELYRQNLSELPEAAARAIHDRYRREYGVADVDFKEICTDMTRAGVLRFEGQTISFRQPYTFCYFVAWHLAQRIHAGDASADEDLRRLWQDLYHEDTANVLVFLAHLTTSQLALSHMRTRASELFATSHETDLGSDVGRINALCTDPQELILPPGNPVDNREALRDSQDERQAERDATAVPRREVVLRPSAGSRAGQDERARQVMEVVTAMRAIEILGQVIRNEATARKVDTLAEITDEVFRLGRRLLGCVFAAADEHLDKMVTALEDHYRHRMPKAKEGEVSKEANWHLFFMYAFTAFAVVKRVAIAVGDRNLKEVFRQIVKKDANLANQMYSLAINLEISTGQLPLDEAETLNDELIGKTKRKGKPRGFNSLARTLLRALVVDYLYLNHVPRPKVQALCQKLGIEIPSSSIDPAPKRLPPKKSGL